MATQLSRIYKTTKDYAGTLTNSTIVVVTVGIEQLTTLAAYRCPCVDPVNVVPNCRNITPYDLSCGQRLNVGYGFAFILAPAIALFVFSFTAQPKVWKVITGCVKKSEEHKRDVRETSQTLFLCFCKALISPFTWISVSLIDGRYLACSLTPLPYEIGGKDSRYSSCQEVAQFSTVVPSAAFRNARSFSQIIGAIFIAVILISGMSIYCISKCTFPLTYYHAKYYSIYRMKEMEEFEDEMEKKAQSSAEANVRQFLKKRREKLLWDRISTVFQFHRDEQSLALYSQLHKWALEDCSSSSSEDEDEKTSEIIEGENGMEMADMSRPGTTVNV